MATADAREKPEVRVFLLHGVTGSGKTEVYLQAIAHALEQGKARLCWCRNLPHASDSRALQGALQFRAAAKAWLYCTAICPGERHDQWHKIRQRPRQVVIGARSAIFAPVDPSALIVVDEEHENPTSRKRRRATMPGMWPSCAAR